MDNRMTFQRYELKYLMSRSQQESLLKATETAMTADYFFHSSIRNLYCDTPSFRLIRDSLDHPVYKEKLRIRSYGRAAEDDIVFLELKKKYDSVVYKRRIELPQNNAMTGIICRDILPDSQIGREIRTSIGYYEGIRPMVFLSYERDAFHSIEDESLRVTFDDCIRYRTDRLTLDSEAWGIDLLPADTVLMEIKTAGSLPIWLVRELSRLGIRKTSFSKYGAAYMHIHQAEQKGLLQYA